MCSKRRIAANRGNSKRSTGPRTQSGKTRSRVNAVRHGLSSKLLADPAVRSETIALAEQIARDHGRPDCAVETRMLTEAELSILRIRTARTKLLDIRAAECAANFNVEQVGSDQQSLTSGHLPSGAASGRLQEQPTGPDRVALAYLRTLPELVRLDRYEQRALARRRRAIGLLLSNLG
jgi:hypothetical protein